MLTAFEQEGDVLEIRSSNFAIGYDCEIPRSFGYVPLCGAELRFQLQPVFGQIAAVLNFSEERLPMHCGSNVVPVSNEEIRGVAMLVAFANEGDRYGLFFMPRNILVEDDVLDAIAFQAGFVGGYLIGFIVTGHKTGNTPVVLGNPSDRHPQSSLKLVSGAAVNPASSLKNSCIYSHGPL